MEETRLGKIISPKRQKKLARLKRAGTQEKTSVFYDEMMKKNWHHRDTFFKIYKPLYDKVVENIPKDTFIIDVGCGSGRFTKVLEEAGFSKDLYLGIDFSGEAIKRAKEWNPGFNFEKANIFRDDVKKYYKKDALYIMLEVLEHITHDLQVLKKIPVGAQIIASVPDFGADAHVRHFKSMKAVVSRYSSVIKIEKEDMIKGQGHNRTNTIFIIVGRRK